MNDFCNAIAEAQLKIDDGLQRAFDRAECESCNPVTDDYVRAQLTRAAVAMKLLIDYHVRLIDQAKQVVAHCPHNWCDGFCDLCGSVKPERHATS